MESLFDIGLHALQGLRASESETDLSTRNEATTRLHLIDRVFFGCLGWDQNDCTAEESFGDEYSDYIFRVGTASLIVEAKREGTYFDLPAGLNHRLYEITYFEKYAPAVYEAIAQAVGYCSKRGVQFGAASNGSQLVAFLGSRTDGTPPMRGKALVFPSLEDMEINFLSLWQTMSKYGIQNRHLFSELRAGTPSPPPAKLSSRLVNYPSYQARNNL